MSGINSPLANLNLEGVFSIRLGGLAQRGVTNIWPVKPFETAMVIKGYTNKIK